MVMAVDTTPVAWWAEELEALRPQERLTPSVWAERYRQLSRRQSARPGPWQNNRAPHLAGIMDLCDDPRVEELNVMKPGQAGVSEAIRNVLLCWADQDPDPVLLVLPDEKKGRGIIELRVLPAIEDTPQVARLLSDRKRDTKLEQIVLGNGFTLHLGYSGSGSSTKSHPARRVINDEVEEFQVRAGVDTDPIEGGKKRFETYEQPLMVNVSTPSVAGGLIDRLFQASDVKLWWWVPCPHCGRWQHLRFDRLRWENAEGLGYRELAARVRETGAVWYQCEGCEEKIEAHDRREMIRRGVWATEAQTIDGDGRVCGAWPAGKRVGVRFNKLGVLWSEWARIAEAFLRAKASAEEGNIQPLFEFITQDLGEPFEQQTDKPEASWMAAKCRRSEDGSFVPAPAGVLPAWTVKILATVDTQKDHFWLVLRAWGPAMRSRRVWHGRVESFEDLAMYVESVWPFERAVAPPLGVEAMAIDAGGSTVSVDAEGFETTRTEEVYQFCMRDPARLHAMKGESEPKGQIFRWTRHNYTPRDSRRAAYDVGHWLWDTNYCKDLLASWVRGTVPVTVPETGEVVEEAKWELNDADDAEYNRQMAGEVKVLDQRKRVEVWKKRGTNHYWDCEAEQIALAYITKTHLIPPWEVVQAEREAMRKVKPPKELRTPDGRAFNVDRR